MYLFFVMSLCWAFVIQASNQREVALVSAAPTAAVASNDGIAITHDLCKAVIRHIQAQQQRRSIPSQTGIDQQAAHIIDFYSRFKVPQSLEPHIPAMLQDVFQVLDRLPDLDEGKYWCCSSSDTEALSQKGCSFDLLRKRTISQMNSCSFVLKNLVVCLSGTNVQSHVFTSDRMADRQPSPPFDHEKALSGSEHLDYLVKYITAQYAESTPGRRINRRQIALAVQVVFGDTIPRKISDEQANRVIDSFNFLDHVISRAFRPLQESTVYSASVLHSNLQDLHQLLKDSAYRNNVWWSCDNYAGLGHSVTLQKWFRAQFYAKVAARLNKDQEQLFAGEIKDRKLYAQASSFAVQALGLLREHERAFHVSCETKGSDALRAIGSVLMLESNHLKTSRFDQEAQASRAVRLSQNASTRLLRDRFEAWRTWSKKVHNQHNDQSSQSLAPASNSSDSCAHLVQETASDQDDSVLPHFHQDAPKVARTYRSHRGLAWGFPAWLKRAQDPRYGNVLSSPQSPFWKSNCTECTNDPRGKGTCWHAPDGAMWWEFTSNEYRYWWRSADRNMSGKSQDGHWWWVYPSNRNGATSGRWVYTEENL